MVEVINISGLIHNIERLTLEHACAERDKRYEDAAMTARALIACKHSFIAAIDRGLSTGHSSRDQELVAQFKQELSDTCT